MDIGKPRNGNVIEFSAKLARGSIPIGAGRHKVKKSGLWVTKKPKPTTTYFDLFGPCGGDAYEVMELGITLAREALDWGDKEFAEKVMNRLKSLSYGKVRNMS